MHDAVSVFTSGSMPGAVVGNHLYIHLTKPMHGACMASDCIFAHVIASSTGIWTCRLNRFVVVSKFVITIVIITVITV